ncbi:MAG TPA: hypothetical protein VL992_21175 [Tepidisphaeraceae bacterium]|nr:hypothetical protein [Tepidisphaeraceae bacterium]
MSIHDLLDRLRRRLAARGAPEAYVRHLLDELEDHYRQAVAAGRSEAEALAALGDETQLVQSTLISLRRDRWIGRHRVACFIVAPLLLYPIALSLVVLPLGMPGIWLARHTAIPRSAWEFHLWKWSIESISNIVFPVTCVWLLQTMSRRFFCGRRFALCACGEIIAWSLAAMATIHLPSTPEAHGAFMLGVGVRWPIVDGYKQILLAFYVAAFLWWLIRHRRDPQFA